MRSRLAPAPAGCARPPACLRSGAPRVQRPRLHRLPSARSRPAPAARPCRAAAIAVTLDIKARVVTVKGPRGSLTKSFKHMAVDIYKTPEGKVKVEKWFGATKESACLRSCCSHMNNMITGVTKARERAPSDAAARAAGRAGPALLGAGPCRIGSSWAQVGAESSGCWQLSGAGLAFGAARGADAAWGGHAAPAGARGARRPAIYPAATGRALTPPLPLRALRLLCCAQGFLYKMRFVYAHFPINVAIVEKDTVVEIRNFLGEKIVRRIQCHPGVTVKRSADIKDEISLIGNDVDNVSLSAALINQSCHVKNKDIRKFLDGIYISERSVIGGR